MKDWKPVPTFDPTKAVWPDDSEEGRAIIQRYEDMKQQMKKEQHQSKPQRKPQHVPSPLPAQKPKPQASSDSLFD